MNAAHKHRIIKLDPEYFLKSILLILWTSLFALIIYTAYQGKPNDLILTLGKPKVCIVMLYISWLCWYWMLTGIRKSNREKILFIAKTGILLASISFCLLIFEIYIRGYMRSTQGFNSLEKLREIELGKQPNFKSHTPLAEIVKLSKNKKLVYELIPDMTREFGHNLLKTNSIGIRESLDYPKKHLPNTTRIVGIGDSGMFGWGIEQNEDYLSVMENQLRQIS